MRVSCFFFMIVSFREKYLVRSTRVGTHLLPPMHAKDHHFLESRKNFSDHRYIVGENLREYFPKKKEENMTLMALRSVGVNICVQTDASMDRAFGPELWTEGPTIPPRPYRFVASSSVLTTRSSSSSPTDASSSSSFRATLADSARLHPASRRSPPAAAVLDASPMHVFPAPAHPN